LTIDVMYQFVSLNFLTLDFETRAHKPGVFECLHTKQ